MKRILKSTGLILLSLLCMYEHPLTGQDIRNTEIKTEPDMNISKELWGRTPDGKEIVLYTLISVFIDNINNVRVIVLSGNC